MTIKGTQRIARRLSFVITGLNGAMLLGGIALTLLFAQDVEVELHFLNVIVYTLMAALIIARQPNHIVGWLLLAVGFFAALGAVVTGLIALLETGALEHAYALQGLISVIGDVFWIPSLMIPLTLILQFFPTGRLPSRRWWLFPIVSVLAMSGLAAEYVLGPVSLEQYGLPNAYNPLAITGTEPVLDEVAAFAEQLFAIGVIGSLLILIVRYRRAETVERTQMKWLFYTAAIGISILLLSTAPVAWPFDIGLFIFVSLPTILAITIGIAILRYRLFDIDIIIRRTLQYGIVTGILALIYFGLVVTLQALVAALGGGRSPVFIVISTLVIAALFNPLRNRVQEVVDRRFYRNKYDAERALAQFAAVARDEVNIDRLGDALLDVVEETMQPDNVQIWLRPVARPEGFVTEQSREADLERQ